MKKIINGKRYDTDTAKEMGCDSYLGPRDFAHWYETLYRKTTGEYFLHGEGGPASKYAETIGQNQWCSGEKIIPLTMESAKKWAEDHLDADEYESIFGVIDETGEKRVISLSLPASAVEHIKRGAAEAGLSMSDYVASLIPKK